MKQISKFLFEQTKTSSPHLRTELTEIKRENVCVEQIEVSNLNRGYVSLQAIYNTDGNAIIQISTKIFLFKKL